MSIDQYSHIIVDATKKTVAKCKSKTEAERVRKNLIRYHGLVGLKIEENKGELK